MKKGMVISVDGGLGDHVGAEPAVRYFVEKVYPEADVHIVCAVPRVFAHLRATVHIHNSYDPERELSYSKRFTFPTTGPLREALCSLTTHMVDYHAAALLYRTLPLADKSIMLRVESEDVRELERVLDGVDPRTLVLVHPGKSWQSKTFPHQWWQEVIDTLTKEGVRVCLVGKSNAAGETGLVQVACPSGGVDLRDKLSLGALFALLSKAPVLISNDSSLVQMAGAFETGIILIATCKHPDFVLPYRNKTPYYRAIALCKRLLVDDLAFEPVRDGKILVDVPVADWTLYLPEVHTVASVTQEFFKKSSI